MPRILAKSTFPLLVFLCVLPAFAQVDTYGGLLSRPCTNSTGHFTTVKDGVRWMLCTPDGHELFLQSVGGALATPTNIIAKYGTNTVWATQQLSFIKSLGFNSIGELSDGTLYPTASTTQLPFIQTINNSLYATVNLNGYASRPIKNFLWGVNGNFTGLPGAFTGAGCIDTFDPQDAVYAANLFATDATTQSFVASPFLVGLMGDDTDFVCGMGATPDFDTTPSGNHKPHLGYMALVSSPLQTFNAGFTYNTTNIQFSDPKVYTKTAAASPPATCSITTPCTLRDYLAKKYGTIAALNTAWGSSYSTFDSAGTVVASETCGTGDGVTTVFTCTLAHNPISPFSVSVSTGGTLQGGDCPWFQSRCSISGTITRPYDCTVTGNCVASFGGGGGTNLVTGFKPWSQSTQATQVDCGACGLPQASYWFRTVWHGSPCASIPSAEQGNTFSTGAPQVTIATQNNANDAPGCATGVDIYVSCRVISGAASHGCVSAASAQPVETLQASNVAYPSGSWTEPTTGLVAGAALPSPPSFIDYHTGGVQLTFSSAPANASAITIGYTYGGWMFGAGLMDEDGRNTSWTGTNPICLTLRAGSTAGSTSFACDGVIQAVANANQTLASDLDTWISQYSAQYFSTIRAAIKATAPNTLYLGADTAGDWDGPPRKEVLQGAAPSLDILFWLWFSNQPDDATGTAKYTYASRYLGDKPMLNFMTLHSQPDSALAGNTASDCCFGLTTEPLRGSQWYTILNKELRTLSYNGTYQWLGAVWWGLYDYPNENINWGLKTATDNAYNAHDAISGTTACAPPLQAYTCGSEPVPGGSATRPFGDLFGGATGVIAANSLWIGQGAAVSGAILKRAIIH